MFTSERGKDHISLNIPSSVSSIGSAIKMLNQFLKQYDVSELSTTQATVVLRELMVNAITHGNKDDASSSIKIQLEHVRGNEFKIMVEDMGAGFNYAAIDTHIPDNLKTIQNRGFALIKAYTNRFEFNRKGNCIAAYISTK